MILPRKHPRNLIAFSICISIIEFVGVSSVMPFTDIAFNPEVFNENIYYKYIYNFFGFDSILWFLMIFGPLIFLFLLFRVVVNLYYRYKLAEFIDEATDQVYSCAFNARTTLNQLYQIIEERLIVRAEDLIKKKPIYHDFLVGDVRHSRVDISKATNLLGYAPSHIVIKGLNVALNWYVKSLT